MRSYEESTVPIAELHQPEVKFLHEVDSGSVCAMTVPSYYERNLRSCALSNMTTKWGVLFSYRAAIALVGYLPS